ncbi:MAG: hypothetical protein AAFY83_06815 [Pseudomonadota bacterium]
MMVKLGGESRRTLWTEYTAQPALVHDFHVILAGKHGFYGDYGGARARPLYYDHFRAVFAGVSGKTAPFPHKLANHNFCTTALKTQD